MGEGGPDCKPPIAAAVSGFGRFAQRTRLAPQKEAPAVGDMTAEALSRRSIRHGHEGEP